MLTMEDLDRFSKELMGGFGLLGFYIYVKFLKAIEIEPSDTQIDPRVVLGRTMRPILDRFAFLEEKVDSHIKNGLLLHDALKKVECDIDSQEDKEIFDVLKKKRIVDDGLDRLDPLWEKFTDAQKKQFLKVDPLDPLAKIDFWYDLFTNPGAKDAHHKKKPVCPKNKKKGRK